MIDKRSSKADMMEPSHKGGSIMNKPSIEIRGDIIISRTPVAQSVAFYRVLQRFDPEILEDETERALFIAGRNQLRCMVMAALAMSWLDERLFCNAQKDIKEYLS